MSTSDGHMIRGDGLEASITGQKTKESEIEERYWEEGEKIIGWTENSIFRYICRQKPILLEVLLYLGSSSPLEFRSRLKDRPLQRTIFLSSYFGHISLFRRRKILKNRIAFLYLLSIYYRLKWRIFKIRDRISFFL